MIQKNKDFNNFEIFCDEEVFDNKPQRMSLDEFDCHVERYAKLMNKEIDWNLFYSEFKKCFGNLSQYDFISTLYVFKENSRHLHNKQLTFFKGVEYV